MKVVFKDKSTLYIADDKLVAISINGDSSIITVDAASKTYTLDSVNITPESWSDLLKYFN